MFELSGVNYEEVLEQGDSILVRVVASSSYSGVRVIGIILYSFPITFFPKVMRARGFFFVHHPPVVDVSWYIFLALNDSVAFKYVGNEERKRKCSMQNNSVFQLNGNTMVLIMKLVSTNDLGSKGTH